MRFKLLGRSGLRVSELCLGAMRFGGDGGASRAEAGRIVGAFADAGGNFVDTADAYGSGLSERWVGEITAADRDRWVIGTKYTISRDRRDPNAAGNHRKNLVGALDASLARLGTDHVDLLWIHIWDFLTPVEEVMRALDDQVRAGKVLHLGVSDTPAWLVARANAIAEERGWTPFSAVQVRYSLLDRAVEREIAPMAEALDIALTAWRPLGAGILGGKEDPSLGERERAIAAAVGEVAAEAGATPAQVALAWLRSRPGVVLPIVGARTEAQVRDSLGTLGLALGDDALARLDAASAIELGFPHDFARWALDGSHVLGDAHDRLDGPRRVR